MKGGGACGELPRDRARGCHAAPVSGLLPVSVQTASLQHAKQPARHTLAQRLVSVERQLVPHPAPVPRHRNRRHCCPNWRSRPAFAQGRRLRACSTPPKKDSPVLSHVTRTAAQIDSRPPPATHVFGLPCTHRCTLYAGRWKRPQHTRILLRFWQVSSNCRVSVFDVIAQQPPPVAPPRV